MFPRVCKDCGADFVAMTMETPHVGCPKRPEDEEQKTARRPRKEAEGGLPE